MYRARHTALRSVVWRDNFEQIEFWNLRKLSLEFRETSIFVIHHLKALGEMSYFSRKITITIHTCECTEQHLLVQFKQFKWRVPSLENWLSIFVSSLYLLDCQKCFYFWCITFEGMYLCVSRVTAYMKKKRLKCDLNSCHKSSSKTIMFLRAFQKLPQSVHQ